MIDDAPVEAMLEERKKYKTEDFEHFLIIWMQIPDTTEFYLIPNIPEMKVPDWLPLVDDFYQGQMELPEDIEGYITRISDALCDRIGYCCDKQDPMATKWSGYMLPSGPIALPDKTLVITTGFFC